MRMDRTPDLRLDSDSPSLAPSLKVLRLHEILCASFGCPIAYFHHLDPLSELVSALLSHRTLNRDSAVAFHALRDRYADWSEVRDAPTADIEAAIKTCRWPELKAPRIQEVLRAITEQRGELSLEFLAEYTVDAARAWLERLPGVGPKSSAATLSFSRLRGRALPVDSHHHRVAIRTGLIPESMSVGPSHRVLESMLPEGWDAQHVYDHHQVMMRHGQRTCRATNPACSRCPVLALCPEGQRRMGKTREAPA